MATQRAGRDFCARRMHLARRHRGSIVRRVALKMMRHARVPVWGNEFTNGKRRHPPLTKSQGLMSARLETVLHYAIH